jgi:hypothetical protein
MMRWARQHRWAGLSQGDILRMRNGHGHSIRMVNETAGGTISWSWHPLFAARKANLLRGRPGFGLTINFPNDGGNTNSSSARARLKLKKPLYRASVDPEYR